MAYRAPGLLATLCHSEGGLRTPGHSAWASFSCARRGSSSGGVLATGPLPALPGPPATKSRLEMTRAAHVDLLRSSSSLSINTLRSASKEGGSGRAAFKYRDQLKHAKRIVVKLGSAVITREDSYGLALGRLASIVEQCSELQNAGHEVMMVSSGAVAFGKQKMTQELRMSLSMRETLSTKDTLRGEEVKKLLAQRAAAAVGQSGLMSLYEAMFAQYGVKIAQILVTQTDFYHSDTRRNLRSTVNELIALNIMPIINTNDAVNPLGQDMKIIDGKMEIRDNDSLAARIASEVETDLLILMTNVNGIYTKPPTEDGARLIDTFNPKTINSLKFGPVSSVGTGGMDSKVQAANWALERGTSVVICNGLAQGAIRDICAGRRLGTFFSNVNEPASQVETQAKNAREGSRYLQTLTPEKRASVIQTLANLLKKRQGDILAANEVDLDLAQRNNASKSVVSRLALTPSKISSLSFGLAQIADTSKHMVGRVISKTDVADGIELTQVTVPIGVILAIVKSRPDSLLQLAALSIGTGNGLLLKSSNETSHSAKVIIDLINEALGSVGARDAISLISGHDDTKDLLQMDEYIDLVIPRGCSDLVRTVIEESTSIPVLGHIEGICHVYLDKDCDINKAIHIVRDAKCDHPAACNSMETLLIHQDIFRKPGYFTSICQTLHQEGVTINAGPKLAKALTFGPPIAKSFRTSYGSLECTIELVNNLHEAISHIHQHGSSHTDVIVTENKEMAEIFLETVDSACVFHNCSSRFADGYRLGLGAEAGFSTARIHARGPVGMEGLLTTKWILRGDNAAAADFTNGTRQFTHRKLPVGNTNEADAETDDLQAKE
ncbi:unnamed protein product [Meganyctiphanes norvegica]|uniref:Delta-1-pyrroline-5-carboxylate synthase n=1 Tax=Meganyctiphanes norvegica TaxID=48144 RepID=A0AAV2PTR5_MEGNR